MASLRESYHTILATQVVVEHMEVDALPASTVPTGAICVRLVALIATERTQTALGAATCDAGCPQLQGGQATDRGRVLAAPRAYRIGMYRHQLGQWPVGQGA